MVEHLIIHMGFPKTGTTSLQTYLKKHKKQLSKFAHIRLFSELGGANSSAQRFAQRPTWLRLRRFRKDMRELFRELPDCSKVVLSREGFSGIMPGMRRWGLYHSRKLNPIATILAKTIVAEARKELGENVKITLIYTIRDQNAWLKSSWGHVLRSIKLKEDFETFQSKYRGLATLQDEVAKIAEALDDVEVKAVALEELADHPAGPASVILEMIGVRPRFSRARPLEFIRNEGQPEQLQTVFLALNRSSLRGEELRLRKEILADDLRESRGQKRLFTTPEGLLKPNRSSIFR